MAVWDFPFHTVRTKYPESGLRVEFGGGYLFSSRPIAPDSRTFVLKFAAMVYEVDSNDVVDATINPTNNMLNLDQFYQEHQMWKTFSYPHVVYGAVNVRFAKPLSIPEGIPGGTGTVKSFDVELVEDV